MLTLTPTAATNEWIFMQTVATPSIATSTPHTMRVHAGSATLETVERSS
jgi:alkaline phosphatase D